MNTMISRLLAARAWRESKRGQPFTNAEFARGLKVEQASVNYWQDKSEGKLKAETVFQAADFLEIDARWLATGQGDMTIEGAEERRTDVIAQFPDGANVIIECKRTQSPPEEIKETMRALVQAYGNGAPRELFDAVRMIFSLLPHQTDANIKPSHKDKTEDPPTAHSASQSIDARAAWEEQEAENALRERGGGSRGARATGERKRKSARH